MVNVAVAIEPSASPYGGERAAAFAAAARHSKLVRFLRVAILGGAAGMIAILFVIAVFDPFGRLNVEASVAGFSLDGSRVAMDRPKLAGFRKDGRPYLVNAERAVQDVLHPTIVELRGIDAEVGIAGGGASRVTADLGVYDTATEHMDISRNVRVKSDQYDVRLTSASIDFKIGVYLSREPVKVVTSNGATIDADSVAATDNGRELTFEGHVRSVLQVGDGPQRANGEPKGTGQ
ncbi:MAG TPA: lipopolysaccharide-assembly, LptC-related protein [Roseiarcus sp.]|jgi:lipopolysaccharide export system protein LptC|nr:lipopolysaccharide-assembly, LptC-related protein [Roseiarcus sp.]